MSDMWLPTLETTTPQDGFALAIKLARMAVKLTQPDDATRQSLRKTYAKDATVLTAASAVVATHFHTVAKANNFWRDRQ